MQIRIATRESALALWQARFVADQLSAAHPDLDVSLVPMTTRGDQILNQPLAKIGGKGLFLKELEQAMAQGRAEIAVHSMKDVPNELPEGFAIGAVLQRHDPRDALVGGFSDVDDLPRGARVGTSSLRRQAQLLHRRPDLRIASLRGNVNTRLARLDAGEHDAIILAAAGLDRLEMAGRIAQRIPASVSLPAVAQGAIAVETLACAEDLVPVLARLHHEQTADCVAAERAVSAALAGSCQVPLAAHATLEGDALHLDALVASVDGREVIRRQQRGSRDRADELGRKLASELLDLGAREILDALP